MLITESTTLFATLSVKPLSCAAVNHSNGAPTSSLCGCPNSDFLWYSSGWQTSSGRHCGISFEPLSGDDTADGQASTSHVPNKRSSSESAGWQPSSGKQGVISSEPLSCERAAAGQPTESLVPNNRTSWHSTTCAPLPHLSVRVVAASCKPPQFQLHPPVRTLQRDSQTGSPRPNHLFPRSSETILYVTSCACLGPACQTGSQFLLFCRRLDYQTNY